jgi:hypothetical protein
VSELVPQRLSNRGVIDANVCNPRTIDAESQPYPPARRLTMRNLRSGQQFVALPDRLGATFSTLVGRRQAPSVVPTPQRLAGDAGD